ncbi:hypothetical protein IKQ02_02640 [bacterium]|nr:hypothetical protein [bacterium]
MADINKDIDNALNLLLSRTKLEKENVLTLQKEISALEDSIEKDSLSSYTLVKDSLANLKTAIKETNERIDDEEWNKIYEKSKIKYSYFSKLIQSKDQLLNFHIDSIDDIILSFETYNNEKTETLKSILDVINNTEIISENFYNNITSIIYNFMFRYHKILIKYQGIYSECFNDIEKRILDLSKIYLNLFDEHRKEIIEIDELYKDKRDSILSLLPHYEEFISQDQDDLREAVDKTLIRSSEVLLNDYLLKKEDISNKLSSESDSIILKIEANLLKTFSDTFNFELTKKETIETLISDTPKEKRENLSRLIMRISSSISLKEFEDTVTEIYKEMFEEKYQYYKEKEKELEKEYIVLSERIKVNKHLQYFLTLKNKDAAFLENALNTEEVELSLSNSYLDSIKNRVDKYFEYSINEIKIISSLEKIKVIFEFSKNLITLSLNKEIRDSLYELKKDLNVERINLEFTSKFNEYFINNLKRNDELLINELNYKVARNKYNRFYYTKKFTIKLAYELYKDSYQLNTFDARMKLDKLNNKYASILKTYDTIYETQKELMERSKSKMELLNLSNYKYAYSFLKHRLLIADNLLDTTISEYNLRITILEDIRSSSRSASNHNIASIISIYMDDVKEITFLKETEIKNLEDEIDQLAKDDEKINAYKKQEKLTAILQKYDAITKKLNEMLVNDPDINRSTEQIETLDRVTIDLINDAQIIRKQSLKNALVSIEKSHESFDALLLSLDTEKIDYDLVLNNYKLVYETEKAKIENELSDETEPLINILREYNEQFNLDYYYKEFNEVDKLQIDKNKEIYKEYISKMAVIEKKYGINPYYKEKIEEKRNEIIDKELSIFNSNLTESNDNFFSKKDKILEERDESLKRIDNETINKSKNQINESLEFKSQYQTTVNDLIKEEKESIRTLKRILRSIRQSYINDLEAIKDSYEDRLSTLMKELENKYKNIDIYTLKGEK